jgi:hypothetical protein
MPPVFQYSLQISSKPFYISHLENFGLSDFQFLGMTSIRKRYGITEVVGHFNRILDDAIQTADSNHPLARIMLFPSS